MLGVKNKKTTQVKHKYLKTVLKYSNKASVLYYFPPLPTCNCSRLGFLLIDDRVAEVAQVLQTTLHIQICC